MSETNLNEGDDTENRIASAGPVERVVIGHDYGENEGGYRLCKKCGAAKHNHKFDGYRFWFSGVGYQQEPKCFSAL